MELRGFIGGLYRVFEWITRFAYLNLLWIFFTLMGLVIVGFFPATVAMFAVTRKWIRKESIYIFETFWKTYKKEFKKSNLLGLILLVIGAVIYVDLMVVQSLDVFILDIISFIFLGLFILYLATVLFIFPIFVHFDLKLFQYLKYAFVVSISHPLFTMMMFTSGVALYYILYTWPGLTFFFSGSVLSYMMMWVGNQTFLKIHRRQQKQK